MILDEIIAEECFTPRHFLWKRWVFSDFIHTLLVMHIVFRVVSAQVMHIGGVALFWGVGYTIIVLKRNENYRKT